MKSKKEFEELVNNPYIGSGGGDQSSTFLMRIWQEEGFTNEEIKQAIFENMKIKPSEKLEGYNLYCKLHKRRKIKKP